MTRSSLLAMALVVGCSASHTTSFDGGGGEPDAAEPAASPTYIVEESGWPVWVIADSDEEDTYGLGWHPHLIIDDEGTFHLTHTHQDEGSALYSRGRPGAWETELIVAGIGDRDIKSVSSALDDGVIHVVFDQVSRGPTWGRRDGDSGWILEPLPFMPGPAEAEQPAIARAPGTGALHAVGVRGDGWAPGSLTFAHVVLGSDGAEAVSDDAIGDDYRSLEIRLLATSSGHLHLAIMSVSNALLLASREIDGRWIVRELHGRGRMDMVESGDGLLHVFYTRDAPADAAGRLVVHARHALDGTFRDETSLPIDVARWQGIRVVREPAGTFHLALEIAGSVHHAVGSGTEWRVTRVDTLGPQNGRPSIALDPGGAPWLAYRDGDSRLVVATPPRR